MTEVLERLGLAESCDPLYTAEDDEMLVTLARPLVEFMRAEAAA